MLNNINTKEFPNNPSVFTQITNLRSKLNEADMQFRERGERLQDIIAIFNNELINFSIKDWNEVISFFSNIKYFHLLILYYEYPY